MNANWKVYRKLFLGSLASFSVLASIGCGTFFVFPNNQTTFTTQTQVFMDSMHTQAPMIVMPRPYQPLRGQMQSGTPQAAPNNQEAFGSNGGAYSIFTGVNGQTTVDYLSSGGWNVYYNWIPEPNGCYSPSGLPSSQTTSGDWNILSASYGSYEPLSPLSPINISYTSSNGQSYYNAPIIYCNMVASDLAGTDSPLVTIGTLPQNLTVTFDSRVPSPLSGNSGGPVTLNVYDVSGNQIGSPNLTATPSSPNAYNVSFPFPTGSNGALPVGIYGTIVTGTDQVGNPISLGGEGYFFMGSANPNFATTPFGVAVQDYSEIDTVCFSSSPTGYESPDTYEQPEAQPEMLPPSKPQCNTSSFQGSSPVVTSLSQGTLTAYSGTISVGQQPVAVVTYGTAPVSITSSDDGGDATFRTTERDIDGTGYALTVNNGSNNVSIVDLVNLSLVATIPVGAAPDAAAIDSGGNNAYIANYTDSTVSVVSLSSKSVVATFPVGSNPSSISIDSSGNIWVGGNGFINEYNSQYALVTSSPVTGIVNSLALSAGQGKVVSNVIQPSSPSSPRATAMVVTGNMSSNSGKTGFTTTADPYVSSSMAPSLVTPYQLGGATVVSANYQNNLAVTATPTGFIVQDVYTGDILASATTSAPIRAIAVDQNFGFAYMTIPDTNTVITFPLPGSTN